MSERLRLSREDRDMIFRHKVKTFATTALNTPSMDDEQFRVFVCDHIEALKSYLDAEIID